MNKEDLPLESVTLKGESWYITNPLVKHLGYKYESKSVRAVVDKSDIKVIYIKDKENNYLVVNETGLNALIQKRGTK